MTDRTDVTVPNQYTGKCLIATPQLDKSMWEQTVLFIAQHHNKLGTQGYVINRPSSTRVTTLFSNLGVYAPPHLTDFIHLGGPVKERSITMLHSSEWYSASTHPITPNISFSYDEFMVEKMCMGDTPDRFTMLAGSATWQAGQLEQEIERGSWLVADIAEDLIFSKRKENIWSESLEIYSQSLFDNYFG